MSNQKMNRRVFLTKAGTLAAALVLAGCAPKATTTEEPAAEKPTEAPKPTVEPTKAPPETINYYYVAWNIVTDAPMVAEEMSKISLDKINAIIDLQPLNWDQFSQKVPLMLAGGEKIDLMFTCNWFNDFIKNVNQGNLADITDLLPTLAPGLWNSMKLGVWDAPRVKGRIYAAPNQQIQATRIGTCIRKDLVDKYNFDLSGVKGVKDLEPLAAALKNDGVYLFASEFGGSPIYRVDMFGYNYQASYMFATKVLDESLTPYIESEIPEFMENMKLTRRWVLEGYMPDTPWVSQDEYSAQFKAGKIAARNVNADKPGWSSEMKNQYGFDFYQISLMSGNPAFMDTGSIIATMTGVSRTTVNVETSVKMLELLNTDVEFYNLICHGIQGKHWVWVNEAKKVIGFPEGIDATNTTYNPATDWMFGNQFNSYYISEQQADDNVWEETKKLNDSAVIAATMGFNFDPTPVEAEISAVSAVNAESLPAAQGLVDPEPLIQAVREKQNAAGIEKIREELRKQLQDWKATKA